MKTKRLEGTQYLENMPFEEAPITSLLILFFTIPCFIASTISSDSICTTSTSTWTQKQNKRTLS